MIYSAPYVKPLIGCLACCLFSLNSPAQCEDLLKNAEPISGIVFEDRNQNGIRDAGEPGVADVSVSNGCDVVLTDSSGRYQTVLAPGQILFISQPSGYTVPADKDQLPQFFYLHYPEGSPSFVNGERIDWRYATIEPTGPLPNSIDFPLHKPARQEERFTAHGFADTQAKTDIDQDMLREDLVNTLLGNPYGAEFTLTLGDVVFDNLDLYGRHKKMMALVGIHNWNLPGNHDVNFASPNAHLANETYKMHFGPTYYSFNYGKVHIVALNNVEYAGAAVREKREGRPYRGYISEDQIRWLEQDLAHVPEDRLILVATHIPLVAEATDGRSAITGPGTQNFNRLLELLKPFNKIYAVAGHDTSNSWKVEVGHKHGWHGQPWIAHTLAEARGAGWHNGPRDPRGVADAMMADGNPNGFYLLKFDGPKLVPEFVPFPFGSDAVQGMRIILDPEMSQSGDSSIHRGQLRPETKVVVNLFDGGPRDSVQISIDGSPPAPMNYVIRKDPFVEKTITQFPNSYRGFEAEFSSHIWESELPDNLASGIHSLVVTSIDEFGQTKRGVLTFEIYP